ncbi:hypothetical protein PPL_00523 [Heterostelium album PN500]|uniref:Thioredoxin domain-containing protein n=1 Tax=Heterostelium pallidum (strain ATCC 26659 / Pp 5 / PN500) TaxID=670386 RepID=D3AWP5_HETP5|nr:hypothetical protein PPL_00523 [Heterostelium album PN500]EFA86718.1 hypothetical protein PPL_00523 [Heterostelium album PN500]|eukprot:XP_020438822.1 hypothetical protein PPL_00523 [Heterostelium album PN500]
MDYKREDDDNDEQIERLKRIEAERKKQFRKKLKYLILTIIIVLVFFSNLPLVSTSEVDTATTTTTIDINNNNNNNNNILDTTIIENNDNNNDLQSITPAATTTTNTQTLDSNIIKINLKDINDTTELFAIHKQTNETFVLLIYKIECTFSQRILPVYSALAQSFPNMTFYRMDKLITTPSLFIIQNSTLKKYFGEKQFESIREWVSAMTETQYVNGVLVDDSIDLDYLLSTSSSQPFSVIDMISTNANVNYSSRRYLLFISTCYVIFLVIKAIHNQLSISFQNTFERNINNIEIMVLNTRSVEQSSVRLNSPDENQTELTLRNNKKSVNNSNGLLSSPKKEVDTKRKQKLKESTLKQQQQQPPQHQLNNRKKKPIDGFVHNRKLTLVIGFGLVLYYCAMMYVRYQHRGLIGFADTLWLCNMAVVLAILSIFTNKPFILCMGITTTFIVHFLWVVDVITWFTLGFFPLGNAEYISWPNITWGEIITSTHHAWYIPLSILLLHRNGGYQRRAWLGSSICGVPVILVSTLFPKEIIVNSEVFYLNINCAQEWWRDVRGWPFSLIPESGVEYLIFLHIFSFVLFSVTHLVMKGICAITIKRH